MIIVLITTLCR